MRLDQFIYAAASLLMLSACATAPPVSTDPVQETPDLDPRASVAPDLLGFVDSIPTFDINPTVLAELRATRSMPEDMPGVTYTKIDGMNGAPPVQVLIADPFPDETDKPVYLHIHGGGYVMGFSHMAVSRLPITAQACECVVVSVDYRLAPETIFPGPMEDNLAALLWVRNNAGKLGIDPDRIAIGGVSAGGGHAAQLSIAARDRGIPIAFQVLIYPMLDDRTGSTRPVPPPNGHYLWTEGSNTFAWTAYLGQPAGSDNPPYGAVPAREEDLTGLPPAWIGVGDIDLFYQENVDYAKRLEAAGVPVELYIAPGAYHGFRNFAPESETTRNFENSWRSALRKALQD